MKIIKKHCHKESNCVFLQLWWRKLLKVAAFVTFPTSPMALFKIHQRFKGHFLDELRVSFNVSVSSSRRDNNFPSEVTDAAMKSFCHFYKLRITRIRSLVVEPACSKNLGNQSCIEFFLINYHKQFVKTKVENSHLSL